MAKLIKTSELADQETMSFLLYGRSGTGKTKSCSTLPFPFMYIRHPMEPTHKHFHERSDVLTAILEPDNYGSHWDDMVKTIAMAPKLYEKGYRAIIIDSITAMSQDYELRIKAMRGKLEFTDWGNLRDELLRMVSFLKSSGMHVVMIAHADITKERLSGINMAQPSTRGSVGESLPHYFSETIFSTTIKDGKELKYRWLHRSNDVAVARTMGDIPEYTEQDFRMYFPQTPTQNTNTQP